MTVDTTLIILIRPLTGWRRRPRCGDSRSRRGGPRCCCRRRSCSRYEIMSCMRTRAVDENLYDRMKVLEVINVKVVLTRLVCVRRRDVT